MQFFLLLPVLVLFYQWKRIVGMGLTLVPIIISISKRLYFAVEYEFPANLVYPQGYKPKNTSKNGFQDSYFKPIPRAATYFVGVFTMFLVLYLQEKASKIAGIRIKKFIISEYAYFTLMIMSGFILLSLVFWPYSDVKDSPEDRWSITANQWYYTLSRPVWGVGLSLMAVAFIFRNTHQTGKVSIIQTGKIASRSLTSVFTFSSQK